MRRWLHRRRAFAEPLIDGDRLALRIISTGEIFYLTGDVQNDLLERPEQGEHEFGRLSGGRAALLHRLVPERVLFDLRLEKRVRLLRKSLAHVTRLLGRKRRA